MNKTQIRLIYNASAGLINKPSVEDIITGLVDAGFEPTYTPTENESDLDALLHENSMPVAVAGGDGTVRAVVTRLIGKDYPIAIIPMGTANNIARAYGVNDTGLDVIAGLKNFREDILDVGEVDFGFTKDYFLEGMGAGFFADALADYDPDQPKDIFRAVTAAVRTFGKYGDSEINYEVDVEGEIYSIFEILNINTLGPRMEFVPAAKPNDGALNFVGIKPEVQEEIMEDIFLLFEEEIDEIENVHSLEVDELSFGWGDFNLHIDGIVYASDEYDDEQEDEEIRVDVKIIPGAVDLWLPNST